MGNPGHHLPPVPRGRRRHRTLGDRLAHGSQVRGYTVEDNAGTAGRGTARGVTRRPILTILAIALSAAIAGSARADIGPPIKIGMPAETRPAASGSPYAGVLQIRADRGGTIETVGLEGDGWVIQRLDVLTPLSVTAGELLVVPFRALPADVSNPLRATVVFSGRKAGRTFDLSPAYFARVGIPRPGHSLQGARAFARDGRGAAGQTIRLHGRMVYDRTGRDVDGDGVDDIPAQRLGVDHIHVEIMDLDDDFYDEEMWSGQTDADGYFDVTLDWDDCDVVGCDDPDIYVRWECDTGVVNVQSAGVIEEDYSWSTKDTEYFPNFTGSEIDFGELSPTDSDDHPALHILTTVVRTHRFIEERTGHDVPEVDVQWPEESAGGGNNAHYYDDEIFLSSAKEWREDTIAHEYGHHFQDHFAPTPDPDYCNATCDEAADNCGHCVWCSELDNIAWSEGWPNWLADVVTRSFDADYGVRALFRRNQEVVDLCDIDDDGVGDFFDDPLRTEGFLGALLRDIEDDMEDRNGDGIPEWQPQCARDSLNLGVEEIFEVVTEDEPVTPLQFINAFRARFPEHTVALWQTANNVATEYTWPDYERPGPVTELDSPTHPLGIGGTQPYIEIELTPPTDDASGAAGYSYTWSDTTDVIPDFTDDPMATETSIRSPLSGLGEWYLRIRARDCADHWSSDSQLFGPFVVTECNGNGIVDACDTDCNAFGTFCNVPGCGYAPDCNVNLVPDACDLADGTSRDCDLNGSPDECDGGSFVSWIGSDGLWHQPFNWDNSNLPGPGDHVCIDVPAVAVVTHSEGDTEVLSIRSAERFVLSGGTLSVLSRSRMESNLTVGFATLSGPGDIRVDGFLSFAGDNYQTGSLTGNGTIDAFGGILIDSHSVWLYDSRRIKNRSHASFRGDYAKELWLNDSAVFENYGTFQASGAGDFRALSGSTSRFINLGTFEKSGPGRLEVTFAFDNWGDVFALGGTLALGAGSNIVSDGLYSGAIGAVIEFGNGTLNLGPQSRVEAHNVVFGGYGGYASNVTVDGTYNVTGTSTFNTGFVSFTPAGNVVGYGDSVVVGDGAATVDFNADEPVQINHYVQSNGWANFNTGLPVTFGTLEQSAGYIQGSDAIEITGQASCSGYLAEAVQLTAAGGMTINRLLFMQDTTVLINRATATYTGINAVIHLAGTSVLNNMGVLNAETDGLIGVGTTDATGLFTNSGTFNKLGPGNTTINVALENSGAVNILSGTLLLRGAGTQSMTGSFNGAPDATLDLGLIGAGRTATYNFGNTSSIAIGQMRFSPGGVTANIDGVYNVSGGTTVSAGMTANFSPAATVLGLGESLNVSGGTANFNCDEPISIHTFTLSGSTSGTVNFNTGQPVLVHTLLQGGGWLSGADEVRVTGPSTWTAGTMLGAGRTVFEDNVALSWVNLRDSRVVRSLQTASHAGQLGMRDTAQFENAGTFDALSDGEIKQWSGSPRFTNTGTFLKRGAGTMYCTVAFHNSGTMELQAGVFQQLNRPYTQDAGVTRLNGGQLTSGLPLDLQGGVLSGSSTITGSVSNTGGIVAPGLPVGVLDIVGGYTQGPAGTLAVELAGDEPGAAYDVLNVSEGVTIDGVLRVEVDPMFLPDFGETFEILTFASRTGQFAAASGLGLGEGRRLDLTYGEHDIVLAVVPIGSPDTDADGDVDLLDYDAFQDCLSGADLPIEPTCGSMDFDADGDVDLSDFAVLQLAFSGQ